MGNEQNPSPHELELFRDDSKAGISQLPNHRPHSTPATIYLIGRPRAEDLQPAESAMLKCKTTIKYTTRTVEKKKNIKKV